MKPLPIFKIVGILSVDNGFVWLGRRTCAEAGDLDGVAKAEYPLMCVYVFSCYWILVL
jgi:hypothetical protein